MSRDKAVAMLDELREYGVNDSWMVEHIIYRYLSSDDAIEILEDIALENDIDLD